jgi:hypothetical protein
MSYVKYAMCMLEPTCMYVYVYIYICICIIYIYIHYHKPRNKNKRMYIPGTQSKCSKDRMCAFWHPGPTSNTCGQMRGKAHTCKTLIISLLFVLVAETKWKPSGICSHSVCLCM